MNPRSPQTIAAERSGITSHESSGQPRDPREGVTPQPFALMHQSIRSARAEGWLRRRGGSGGRRAPRTWSRGRCPACDRAPRPGRPGVTGRSAGASPWASVRPRTSPPGMPAPKSRTRVGPAVMVAAGVGVDLGRPAELAHHHDQRVVEQARARRGLRRSAATPLSSGGARVFLIVGKFCACVSQPSWPAPRSLTVTNETPASTSRRASRHDWPTVVRPYFSRTASGSSSIRNAACAARRGQQRVGLLGELVAAGRQRRRRDVVGEVVERLDHVAAAQQPLERQRSGGVRFRTRKPA